MSEHISNEMLERYIDKDLDPRELLDADEHLAECDRCLESVGGRARIDLEMLEGLLTSSDPSGSHLEFDQLEKYVDGNADETETEIVEFHVEECASCAGELNGLFEMRKLIASDLGDQADIADTDEAGSGWIPSWLPGGAFSRLALAAVAIASVVGVGFFLLYRTPPSDVAVNTGATPSGTLRPQSPAEGSEEPLPSSSEAVPTDTSESPAEAPIEEYASLPAPARADIERALSSGDLLIPTEIRQLSGRTGMLMGGQSQTVPFSLRFPLGRVIRTSRPSFSWTPLPGAESYVVEISDSNFNSLAKSGKLRGTSWKPDRALPGDRTLIWQVTAIKNDEEIISPARPAPDAAFRILDSRKSAELDRMARANRNSHLALGILYARAGLLEEAAGEFQAELRKNPGSTVARKFLREVHTAASPK